MSDSSFESAVAKKKSLDVNETLLGVLVVSIRCFQYLEKKFSTSELNKAYYTRVMYNNRTKA